MHIAGVISICTLWGCLMLNGLLQAGEAPVTVPVAGLFGDLKSTDSPVQLRAIDQLGALGGQGAAAVAPLTELLKDARATVRAHAARSLGAIGAAAKSAVPALVELVKDPDEAVRRHAVQAVVAIHPGPQVTVPLCVKLLEDADPGVRMRVLQAIAEVGQKAVPGLIEALNHEKAAYWACLALRDIGPAAKDAVPALVQKLKDPQPEIRREAVLALGAIGSAADPAAAQIAALLDDEHVRTAATFALGQIGQIPGSAEATIRTNAKSDNRMLSTTSLWALARVHPEDKDLRGQVTEQLIARLKDQDPFVRVAAARALAALPPAPEITAPLWEKALADADETTVQHALDALASLGAAAVPRLIDQLKHEKFRSQIVYILGQIGPPAAPAAQALAKLVNDKNDRVAHEAIVALGDIGPGAKDAVPVLLKALTQGEDENLNFTAITYALGKIGPDAAPAEQALLDQLKSSDHYLALVSAWALLRIDAGKADVAARAVPVLIEGLALPLPAARLSAAEALGSLGLRAKAAAVALKKLSSDEDQDVREAAAKALAAVEPSAAQSAAAAYEIAVVVEQTIAMRVGDTVVAQFPKGTELRVLERRPPWVAVQATVDGKPKTGWVLETQCHITKKP